MTEKPTKTLDVTELDAVVGGATEGADYLMGTNSNDVLSGWGGNDYLDGGTGNDYLNGGAGDDSIVGGAGDDTLVDGQGFDMLSGGAGNDRLEWTPNGQHDFFNGGDGLDTVMLSGDVFSRIKSASFTLPDMTTVQPGARFFLPPGDHLIELNDGSHLFLSGIESVTWTSADPRLIQGTQSADVLAGDYRDNFILGGDGDDRLSDGQGADTLSGGSGNDQMQWQPTGQTDTFIGGDGVDTLKLSGDVFDRILSATFPLPIASTVREGMQFSLPPGDHTLTLIDGSVLKISGIESVVWTSNKPGLLDGTEGGDSLGGTGADDVMSGLGGNDQMSGGQGNDVLDGGANSDTLDGGFGNDVLFGGAGTDRLTGGAGADTFVYDRNMGGRDQITDFDLTTDRLVIFGSNWGEVASFMRFDPSINSTVIDFGNGNVLTLKNISPERLTPSHFDFRNV